MLALCGCCRESDSGCFDFPTKSPAAKKKVAQAWRQEVVLQQRRVSLLWAGGDLLSILLNEDE